MDELILIDGDILVYQIGFSVESYTYQVGSCFYKTRKTAEQGMRRRGWHNKAIKKHKNYGTWEQAKLNLHVKINTILDDIGSKNYKMFITASGIENNFRYKVATLMPYKGNRAKSEKPLYYDELRNYLVSKYKAVVVTGHEADDEIGIWQYRESKKNGHFNNTIIASIDKDLKMLEGTHYHLNTRVLEYINTAAAYKNWAFQILTGDVVDNIPGLYKIMVLKGMMVDAKALVKSHYIKAFEAYRAEHGDICCLPYVENSYKRFGLEKELQEIKQLTWIKRE